MDYFTLADAIYSERKTDERTAYFRQQWYQFRQMDRLEKELSLTKNRLGLARQVPEGDRERARA